MTYKDGTDQHYDGNIVYISAETIALLNVTTSRSKHFFKRIWKTPFPKFGLQFFNRLVSHFAIDQVKKC